MFHDIWRIPLADSRLGTVEQRVAHALQKFPETRDSDTALAIKYWQVFQADVIEAVHAELEVLYDLQGIDTITRSRRHLQNDLGLFQGRERTRQLRSDIQAEFHQYLAQKRLEDPEIRFYLDETGNDPNLRYTGLAGICIIDWRQYEKFHAALTQWRESQGWPATIHFADLDSATMPRALSLLAQLQKRRRGLLFAGHSIPSRGRKHFYLMDLFIQLILDSVNRLQELHCLSEPRGIKVIKEAEAGFDSQYLDSLRDELEKQLDRQFCGLVYLREIVPRPKGRDVMLECADLIAASMHRRALHGGWNPKDRLAEAVMNVTGFGDPDGDGVVYRAYH